MKAQIVSVLCLLFGFQTAYAETRTDCRSYSLNELTVVKTGTLGNTDFNAEDMTLHETKIIFYCRIGGAGKFYQCSMEANIKLSDPDRQRLLNFANSIVVELKSKGDEDVKHQCVTFPLSFEFDT